MNIEKGKYWDEACNPIVTDRCTCEVVNCWAKDMLRRFPTLNPSPDENGVGWYPDRLNKISVTGAAKVYAMCWLGDIGWDIYNISLDVQILEMFDIISGIEDGRIMHGLQPHSHLFLTKWPAKLRDVLKDFDGGPMKGAWIGTSLTGARNIDHRRGEALLKLKGWHSWLSIEPLLAPVYLKRPFLTTISQVIVGAETGKNARPCNLDWIRSLRDQCGEAGVPFFVKQIDAKRNRELDGQLHNALAWRT